jgi:hypothetical protein
MLIPTIDAGEGGQFFPPFVCYFTWFVLIFALSLSIAFLFQTSTPLVVHTYYNFAGTVPLTRHLLVVGGCSYGGKIHHIDPLVLYVWLRRPTGIYNFDCIGIYIVHVHLLPKHYEEKLAVVDSFDVRQDQSQASGRGSMER